MAGGPDYYPGSRTSSPSFSFSVGDLRVAGEGDLLAQLARLRKQLHAEGLFEPQKNLRSPPSRVRSGSSPASAARRATTCSPACGAAAGRAGSCGPSPPCRIVTPRRAIAEALGDLAACGEVEVIVVARGGGSLADLFAFCDETLCRTVALLPVPVVASVGHHTDRTLIDDVAAVSCSTPTHAAEAAVPLDCARARESLTACATALARHGRRAVLDRARALAALSRAPAEHVARHRSRLHQQVRELRASARRGVADRRGLARTHGLVLDRKATATTLAARTSRMAALDAFALALAAHDPDRTLARGYALVQDDAGQLVTGVEAARAAGRFDVRFHDGAVRARVEDDET